jgi:hypothetical protein
MTDRRWKILTAVIVCAYCLAGWAVSIYAALNYHH